MPDDQRVALLARPRPKRPETVAELLGDDDTIRKLGAVAIPKYLPADRAARLAINAVNKIPDLARCTPRSFMGALMGATALGLEPNTLHQHCVLIPRKVRKRREDQNGQPLTDGSNRWIYDEWFEAQLMIEYRGFVTLFYRNDLIHSMRAEAIYDVDHFRHRIGTETVLEFEKSLDKPRLQLRGAFCYTRLERGESFTVLPTDEIWKARSRSDAFRAAERNLEKAKNALEDASTDKDKAKAQKWLASAQNKYDETPWVLWLPDMAAKTAIRRHAKQTDLGQEAAPIALAADLDALGDAGLIDIDALADPERAEALQRGEVTLDRRVSETPEEGAGTEGSETESSEQTDDSGKSAAPEPERAPADMPKSGTPQKDLF